MGDINNQLLEFERHCSQGTDQEMHPPIAKYLFSLFGVYSLEFPYAHFATENLSADTLFPIVWEAIRQLECMGFNVIAITADGASVNRKFFRMHSLAKTDDVIHKVKNPYASDDRFVYFGSDPPHLMKTTRNCWSHLHAHGRTRHLWVSNYS